MLVVGTEGYYKVGLFDPYKAGQVAAYKATHPLILLAPTPEFV